MRIFGEQQARAIKDLTNSLIVFGGSKDSAFNREISDLLGTRRVTRRNHQHGGHGSVSTHGEDTPVIRPEQLRELPGRTALVVAENGKPILATLHRAIDGKHGKNLLTQQQAARQLITATADSQPMTAGEKTALAHSYARQLGLTD